MRHIEYHKKYADIQINIDGSERWEYTVDGSPEGTFDVASDFGLKKGDASGCGTLGDDRFVIFFPDELHKPSCIQRLMQTRKKSSCQSGDVLRLMPWDFSDS